MKRTIISMPLISLLLALFLFCPYVLLSQDEKPIHTEGISGIHKNIGDWSEVEYTFKYKNEFFPIGQDADVLKIFVSGSQKAMNEINKINFRPWYDNSIFVWGVAGIGGLSLGLFFDRDSRSELGISRGAVAGIAATTISASIILSRFDKREQRLKNSIKNYNEELRSNTIIVDAKARAFALERLNEPELRRDILRTLYKVELHQTKMQNTAIAYKTFLDVFGETSLANAAIRDVVFQLLKAVSSDIASSNRRLDSTMVASLLEKMEVMNDLDLLSLTNVDYSTFATHLSEMAALDSLRLAHDIDDHQLLRISIDEFRFRMFNVLQRIAYEGLSTDDILRNTDSIISSQRITYLVKTSILNSAIEQLNEVDSPKIRLKAWLAIDRMLNDIELKTSESEYVKIGDFMASVALSQSDVLSYFSRLITEENDPEVKQMALNIARKYGYDVTTKKH